MLNLLNNTFILYSYWTLKETVWTDHEYNSPQQLVKHEMSWYCYSIPSRKRYVKMRESLVRFRSLVHMYVNRKRYIKVHEIQDNVSLSISRQYNFSCFMLVLHMENDAHFSSNNSLAFCSGTYSVYDFCDLFADEVFSPEENWRGEEEERDGKMEICARFVWNLNKKSISKGTVCFLLFYSDFKGHFADK